MYDVNNVLQVFSAHCLLHAGYAVRAVPGLPQAAENKNNKQRESDGVLSVLAGPCPCLLPVSATLVEERSGRRWCECSMREKERYMGLNRWVSVGIDTA